MTSAPIVSTTVPSLKRGFLWSLLGSSMSLLGSWGLMMVLVHTGSPQMVGQYGIALAVVAPVMAFANLQLRALQGTDAGEEFAFGDYLALRLLSSSLALLWVLGMVAISTNSFTVRAVIIAIAIKLVVLSLADVYYGLFQLRERLDKVAQATIWTNGINLGLFAVAMVATGNLIVAVMASSVACLLPLFFHNIPVARKLTSAQGEGQSLLRPRWNRSQLRRLFLQALPLAVVSLLISLNANVPRYFLANDAGTEALGVFVALVSLLVASDTFTSAVAQTVSPRLGKHFVRRERSAFLTLLWRLERLAMLIGIFAILAAYWAGPTVVSWIYQPVYAEERGAIVWLAVSAAIGMMSRFVANAITAARQLHIQVVNNAVSLLVLSICCAFWVPTMGIEGAAMAITAASLVRFLLNLLVLTRLLLRWSEEALPLSVGR